MMISFHVHLRYNYQGTHTHIPKINNSILTNAFFGQFIHYLIYETFFFAFHFYEIKYWCNNGDFHYNIFESWNQHNKLSFPIISNLTSPFQTVNTLMFISQSILVGLCKNISFGGQSFSDNYNFDW